MAPSYGASSVWVDLSIQTVREIKSKKVLDQSAKLAFYFLLSLFPLLLILVNVFGILLSSRVEFQETIQTFLITIVPPSSSSLINSFLTEIINKQSSVKLTFGLIFTGWSAKKGMLALIEGLNIVYEVQESRSWWKRFLISLSLTVVILLLNIFTITILFYGHQISQFEFWYVVEWVSLIIYVMIILNLIYRYGPNVEVPSSHWLTPGTYIAVTFWLTVSFVFRYYLSFFNQYSLTYGSISTAIILMFWLYLSGASVLIGGIVNSVILKNKIKMED